VDLDFHDLRKGCPLPKIQVKKPDHLPPAFSPAPIQTKSQWIEAIQRVLSHLNSCDQSIAGYQFDSTVQGLTVVGPYGGINGRMPNDIWLSSPIRGKPFGAAAAVGYNPLYGEIDPAGMAKLMTIVPISKLIASGVSLADMVLCDNFYTPRVNEQVAWQLTQMVQTCCHLSKELGTPFISGKDSSSGTFIGQDGSRLDIPPTLCVMALGRLPDVSHHIPKPFQSPGNRIYLVGPLSTALGGSIYLDTLGERGNQLPDPDINELKSVWQALHTLQSQGIIHSASALSAGGIMMRVFEMALGSDLGCELDLRALTTHLNNFPPEIGLFAEMIGSIIIEVEEEQSTTVENKLQSIPIGTVQKEKYLSIQTSENKLTLKMKDLIKIWEEPFKEVAR
jgi:phosphoribosylformylglycinamidine synthase